MRSFRSPFLSLLLALLTVGTAPLCAQDITNLGGDLATTLIGPNALQVATPNISSEELRRTQLIGFDPFHTINTRLTGLGPRFVNRSCSRCHIDNGKGRTRIGANPKDLDMVIKVSLPGLQENGAPIDVPRIGEQLQHRNLRGNSRFKIRLRWRRVRGTYPDGTRYTLRRPRLRYRIKGFRPSQTVSSLRMSPILIGLGLLESISEETILGWSDPNDENSDGISGEPQYVIDKKSGERVLGRFGFRASLPTVEQQTAAAAFHDMGLTSSIFPSTTGLPPELSDDLLLQMTVYQQLPGLPIARNQADPAVLRGKELFQTIGCDSCHKLNVTTSSSEYTELDGQLIHPFTDMLLHDMGEGLADKRPEFEASGSEWRTTPLWGLGFAATLNNVKIRYLHDGRARTIEEAILWHGGEAAATQEAFKNLPLEDREALIAFLRSL